MFGSAPAMARPNHRRAYVPLANRSELRVVAARYFICDETKNVFGSKSRGCGWCSDRWITETHRGNEYQ